jgi:hypothetical protein
MTLLQLTRRRKPGKFDDVDVSHDSNIIKMTAENN